jgi:hypothetical protein
VLKHLKRMWGHYLALSIIIVVLPLPLLWIYRIVQDSLGSEVADLALSVTIVIVFLLALTGATYAHRIRRLLRDEAAARCQPAQGVDGKPVVLEAFGVPLFQYTGTPAEIHPPQETEEQQFEQILSFPRKRRGKQPRFPVDKIRKAVLRWENRDPSLSPWTLEEFLEQEFGSSPDGILLMATTTFYDWRRRVLKEIEEQQHDPG